MLRDDLEAIVLGRVQGGDHRIVHHSSDGAAIIGRVALSEIDSSERHFSAPCSSTPTAGLSPLERDNFSLNRHPALASCLSMIFSENRCTLFGIMLYAAFAR